MNYIAYTFRRLLSWYFAPFLQYRWMLNKKIQDAQKGRRKDAVGGIENLSTFSTRKNRVADAHGFASSQEIASRTKMNAKLNALDQVSFYKTKWNVSLEGL